MYVNAEYPENAFDFGVMPHDFIDVTNALFDYINYDWCKSEFNCIFPESRLQFLWDQYEADRKSDHNLSFIRFYKSLDPKNTRRLISRIMDKRYFTN